MDKKNFSKVIEFYNEFERKNINFSIYFFNDSKLVEDGVVGSFDFVFMFDDSVKVWCSEEKHHPNDLSGEIREEFWTWINNSTEDSKWTDEMIEIVYIFEMFCERWKMVNTENKDREDRFKLN